MSDDQMAGMQDAPDVPVDPALAQRVMALYQQVDELLDDLRIPDDERKEVEKNLMEAIAADLLVRLGERLSEEDKQDLALLGSEGKEPDLNLVAGFFRDKFAQEELVQALAEATEGVLKEFADAMR